MNTPWTPREIESRSMEIVEGYLEKYRFVPLEKTVVKRVIHATADPGLAENLVFNLGDLEANPGEVLKSGLEVHTDVNMLKEGISRKLLERCSGRVYCYINDREIHQLAREWKVTRAAAAMYRAAGQLDGAIVAIGNAPTSLFALLDIIDREIARPALVVGIPVGFVGAAEAKEALVRRKDLPYVTLLGPRGGSPVAAAVLNALLGYEKGADS